ncbi:UNVERIFIED_CONTAM: hypothetical protein K2H54_040076 [Gekko kuhli]
MEQLALFRGVLAVVELLRMKEILCSRKVLRTSIFCLGASSESSMFLASDTMACQDADLLGVEVEPTRATGDVVEEGFHHQVKDKGAQWATLFHLTVDADLQGFPLHVPDGGGAASVDFSHQTQHVFLHAHFIQCGKDVAVWDGPKGIGEVQPGQSTLPPRAAEGIKYALQDKVVLVADLLIVAFFY